MEREEGAPGAAPPVVLGRGDPKSFFVCFGCFWVVIMMNVIVGV